MPSQRKTANTVSQGSGGTSWFSIDNIKTDNTSYTQTSVSAFGFPVSETSNILTLSDFGFSIPSGATITGVTLRANYYTQSYKDPRILFDPNGTLYLQMAVSGSTKGTEQADSFSGTSNGEVTSSFGGESNMLGATLSVSDVNSSNFQLRVKSYMSADGAEEWVDLGDGFGYWDQYGSDISLYVDYADIEIHYTEPPSGNMFLMF